MWESDYNHVDVKVVLHGADVTTEGINALFYSLLMVMILLHDL